MEKRKSYPIAFSIGDGPNDEINKATVDQWLAEISSWIQVAHTTENDPRGKAEKVLQCALHGTKLNGEMWKGVEGYSLAKRIKQMSGWDVEKHVGRDGNLIRRRNKGGNNEYMVKAKAIATKNKEVINEIEIAEFYQKRDKFKAILLEQFPHLVSPVYDSKVSALVDAELKMNELSDIIVLSKGSALKLCLENQEKLRKSLNDLMIMLSIHPDQLKTQVDKSDRGDVGTLLNEWEKYGTIAEEYETVDAIQELIQTVRQANNLRLDGSPQLANYLLWAKTGCAGHNFTCECLHYKSLVLLPNGKYIQLGQIVENELDVTVMSFNLETGGFEPKRVTNWFSADLPEDRKWLHLSYKDARGAFSDVVENRGIWATNNHKVLTKNGWKRVDQLEDNDKLILKNWNPNPAQKELIWGSLLGDGSISKNNEYRMVQTESKEEYLRLKVAALVGETITCYKEKARRGGKAAIRARSSASVFWKQEREKWYPNGVKQLPKELKLTPLVLAVWYMDDGHLTNGQTPSLATNCFTDTEIEILKQKLLDIGIEQVVTTFGNATGTRRPNCVIRINKGRGTDGSKGSNKFFELVAPYIPTCMQYKLPVEFQGKFDIDNWNLGLGLESIVSSPIVTLRTREPTSHNKFHKMYCIEVEGNHNFVTTGGIVVENCGKKWELYGGFTKEDLEKAAEQAYEVFGFGIKKVNNVS